MADVPVPAAVDEFLRAPHHAVMATVTAAGTPRSVATWYDWEAGRVLLSLDHSRARLRHIEANPAISLTVLDKDDWYRHISLSGVVDETHPDDGLTDIDRIATRYTGGPYPNRTSPRVSVWLRVERWHGWDSGKPWR